jgi:hypothetical protein
MYNCYDKEYLVKSIFGKFSEKREFVEIIQIISYAVLNNDPQSYRDASDWFADRDYIDLVNHFNRIAIGIDRQRERLYRSKNVC